MNKILEAFAEYIESIIEQKLANRPQHGLDPTALTKLIDERIAAALIDQTPYRQHMVDAMKAHFDEVGINMAELSDEVAKYMLNSRPIQPTLERMVKDELREIIREEIGEAVTEHLKENEDDLNRAVSTYFENEVENASDVVRRALRGFTVSLTDPRETF